MNGWASLSPRDRARWLASARDRALARGDVRPPPGLVFELPGSLVTDLTSFLCAIGEAVNGPGGYFGRSVQSFDDCCHGGFGATLPFTVRWRDAQVSRRALDHAALASWAKERLDARSYLDEEGQRWLEETVAAASRGEGPTLYDMLVEMMRSRGIEVDEQDAG